MATIEIEVFQLVDGTDEMEFLAADALVQPDFAYQQSGLERRTTARGERGNWLVLTQWDSDEAAGAASEAAKANAVVVSFRSLINPATVRGQTFHSL